MGDHTNEGGEFTLDFILKTTAELNCKHYGLKSINHLLRPSLLNKHLWVMPFNENVCRILALLTKKSSASAHVGSPYLPDLSLGAACTQCQKRQGEESTVEIAG